MPLDGGRRSPYGERGLKYSYLVARLASVASLSLRRAWIEIQVEEAKRDVRRVALLTESVD